MASSRTYSLPTLVSVDEIAPAAYNPRRIDEEQFASLCESIRSLGFVIPVIVNRETMTIVAGHQRTRAARSLGIAEVPAYFVSAVTENDECRYNQIHNSTSFTFNEVRGQLAVRGEGFGRATPDPGTRYSDDAAVVKAICQLTLRYGNVLSAVCDSGGRVVYGHQYVEACRHLGLDANLYALREGLGALAGDMLSREYGVFSYDGLERKTWVQGMAQMKRLAPDKTRKQNRSRLYETCVIPNLAKGEAVLDFGAGRCAYAERLFATGYDVTPLEFYPNDEKRIDVAKARRMIDRVLRRLRQVGPFDKVVCDSVLNSVNSPQAYLDVIRTCSAMLRDGGTLYISGRNLSKVQSDMRKGRNSDLRQNLYYLDDDGFSASFRQGAWYFQKFDRREDVVQILAGEGLEECGGGASVGSYQIVAKKVRGCDWRDSVRREFDLPYPGGSYGMGEAAVQAMEKAFSKLNQSADS